MRQNNQYANMPTITEGKYMKDQDTTHFGYEQVAVGEKSKKVAGVFHSVASKYDVMNDLMSMGTHRIWKFIAINMLGFRRGHTVLDIAGGTGDLAAKMAPIVGPKGLVVLSDINSSMLAQGRDRMLNKGLVTNIDYALINGEELPFADNTFDRITLGFGLRNMTDKDKALAAIYRVLKPGGRLLVLEFSKPVFPGLDKIYDLYSFSLLPKIGKFIAKDEDSYRYLAESIRKHPDQDTLLEMFRKAGFEDCDYHNLSGGIVAIHRGYKY